VPPTGNRGEGLNALTHAPSVRRVQRGVVRVNCIDCLDRTNVAQLRGESTRLFSHALCFTLSLSLYISHSLSLYLSLYLSLSLSPSQSITASVLVCTPVAFCWSLLSHVLFLFRVFLCDQYNLILLSPPYVPLHSPTLARSSSPPHRYCVIKVSLQRQLIDLGLNDERLELDAFPELIEALQNMFYAQGDRIANQVGSVHAVPLWAQR
jgi:hypothetical protein